MGTRCSSLGFIALLVITLASCTSVDTGSIASGLREGAETYRAVKDDEDKREAAEKEQKATAKAADAKVAVGAPDAINIQNQTYIRRGEKQTSQSGFRYAGQWYERVNEQHPGALFVEGNPSQGNGFWQSSKYWVPASGSGGAVTSGTPRVINLGKETYVTSGSARTSGSGFQYNGMWYARSNEWIQGTEFREGKQSDGNGFWQHSKYWVPKN